MTELEFTQEKNQWVSPVLTPDDGVVSLQLGFNERNAKLVVEMRIDESLPWSTKAVVLMPAYPDTWCEKITGIGENDLVRIRTNYKPMIAAMA